MIRYQAILKYSNDDGYPAFSWRQKYEPAEHEILVRLREFAIKNNIPEKYLEEKCFIYVDGYEDGLFTNPELYKIEFSRLGKNDIRS